MSNASEISVYCNLDNNKVYFKSLKNNSFIVKIESWNSMTGELELLYKTQFNVEANQEYWTSPSSRLATLNGFKITVEKDGAILKEEFVRVKSYNNGTIKKQVIAIKLTRGLGDILTATPAIKKFSEAFNQKIILITTIPDVFVNNPYIEEIVQTTEKDLENCIRSFQTPENIHKYNVFETYHMDYYMNWRLLDIKQLCAANLGFHLKQHEADLLFYPDPYEKINDLPDNFICVNPSVTSLYRSWGQENWQEFINLIQNHIPVVAIGKGTAFDPDTYKNFYKIEVKNGLNLMDHPCQNTLSQAYHIISKSKTFVTMNNGLYCLALSTYNHITELATPLDSYFLRIRKGIPNFNLNYLAGSCDEFCNGNLKYSAHFTGTTDILRGGDCFLGISPEDGKGSRHYKCYPSPKKVYESVLTHLKSNKYIV